MKSHNYENRYRGIVSGLTQAFVLDAEIRNKLINEDQRSAELIKPLLVGDDVRKYEAHFRESYLIYTQHGVDIDNYPAVKNHLLPFRKKLEARANNQKWYELQQPQSAYVEYFNNSKIIYPEIGKNVRFVIDENKFFINNKVFFLPIAELFILAVLNSSLANQYLRSLCSQLLGDVVEFRSIYMETLPIPNASDDEREAVAELARETQNLHGERRARVELFLLDVGTSAAESSSRNALEKPWELTEEEFLRRTRSRFDTAIFRRAKDETLALTEQTNGIEREIDERVAALYGVSLNKQD